VSPGEWIAALRRAAADAREAAGHVDFGIDFAGRTVRIRLSPPDLRPFLRPLAGVEGENGGPVTIEVWDVAACGVRPPSLPREALQADGRGEIRWLVSPTTAGAWQETGPMLLAWDAEAETVSGWIGASARLPAWERAAPLRVALNWVLRGPRRALAHAAAVGRAGGGLGLLIAGPGGSGKSTTALSWLLAGGDFAGDDYVLVDLDGAGGPSAGPIYATAKADGTAIELLPELAGPAAVGVDEYAGKSILDVRKLRPDQPAGPITLGAVVVPRVTGGRQPDVRPIAAAAMLKALAPSSMLQLPGEAGGLAVLAALVRDLPCFELDLARDASANVDALERLLPA
jgi:hypothetical protein